MDANDIVASIRARVDQYRRLAAGMTDERTRKALLQMAAEGEADIERIKAEGAGPTQTALPEQP